MEQSGNTQAGSKGRSFKLILLFLFIAGLVAVNYIYDPMMHFTPEAIGSWLSGAGPMAPLIYILVMALSIVISPIPSIPLDMAAGAFFGPVPATFYSAIGALIGADISFLIARYLGRGFVERFIKVEKAICLWCSDSVLVKIVFVSRLIPFISFDVVSYGAGLTRMSLWKFSLATFLGMLPMTYLFASSGSFMVTNRGLAYALGALMVVMFLLLPKVLEKTELRRKLLQNTDEK
jgi:uncharacterized membrane protein YdjX (TVP38/TMEM64 family)